MSGRDVVLIGASAGGFRVMRQVLAELPAGFGASVLVVLHTADSSPGALPEMLAASGALPTAYAVDGQRLTPGSVAVAPAGQHLRVETGDVVRLDRGALVKRTRPAIDPLFRSAAEVYGPRVVAVVLSGRLDDGAAGAAAVAAAGGAVLVQDPADAEFASMPLAALALVPEAVVLPAAKLGRAVVDLVTPPVAGRRSRPAAG